MLVKGVELTIQGNRAKDPKLKVVKAARVIIKRQDLQSLSRAELIRLTRDAG